MFSLVSAGLAALAVTSAFAALAYGLGMVSRSGAAGGIAIGTVVFACLGPSGFAVLALFVVGGSGLTRLGYLGKKRRGTAQASGGRRGARNAFANCGVAVACALLTVLTPHTESWTVAFVASLGAAFADTAESEVGQLGGAAPRLLTTLRSVPAGTDGAVSGLGTLAGVGAAALTAMMGLALGLIQGPWVAVIVAVAAFGGTVADSLVGATLPRIGNEATNALCTLTASLLALLCVGLL